MSQVLIRLSPQFAALLAGVVYPFGFAPFSIWPLAILSVAGLFYLVSTQEKPALNGFIYGLGAFGVGISWVYVSMVNFGNMPIALAVLAVIIFVAVLSCFTSLFGFLAARNRTLFHLLLVMPALWVISEALRGWVLTGLPWLLLGYASIDSPLAGWAPIAGVMGNSFILAMLAGALVCSVLNPARRVLSIAIVVVLVLIGMGLSKVDWATPTEKQLAVALVQRNISLAQKWQPGQAAIIREDYLTVSQAIPDTDLIVWPEAAIPQVLDRVPQEYYARLRQLPGQLALGGVESKIVENQRALYNSLVVLGGNRPQTYRKQHLVPYGEYFPLKWLVGWLMEKLQIPMSNFSSWKTSQAPLSVNGVLLAPTICYEDAFPEEWREVAGQSDVLLNISEDAWFGNSFAPHQRLEMARFRALEMARPMIRVSNSGLSALIDDRGAVRAISPQFQPYVLQGQVEGKSGLTWYVKWGRWPLYLFVSLLLLIAVVLNKQSRRKQRGMNSARSNTRPEGRSIKPTHGNKPQRDRKR